MQLETGLGDTSSAGSVWTKIERAITARRGAFALALIVLSSLAFRMYMSRDCSLTLDEAATHQDVLKPWPEILKGPSREHPPLMYIVVKLALGLLGESETAIRSVSLFFGCVLLVAVYQLCLEFGLTVGRSLLVVGAFALSPFFIRHTTEARQYAMLGAFITLAIMHALRLLRGPVRIRVLVGFAASAAAAAWTQYFGLAYALALLGTLAIGIRPIWRGARPSRRVALVAVFVVLLVLLGLVAARLAALAHYYSHGHYAKPSAGAEAGPLLNTELLLSFPLEFSFLTSEAWSLAIQPLLALVGLVLLTLRSRGSARLLPLGIGVAPCLAATFISSGHFIAARYLAPSAVLYHLGACFALFAAFDRLRSVRALAARPALLVPSVAWLVLGALLTARLWEYPDGFGAGVEYYQGLQRYFLDNLAKDTRAVIYFGDFGKLLYGKEYRLGSPPISLERFRPVRGIDRYLVVEINVFGDRRPAFEALITRRLGLSVEAWRALPLVPLPHTRFQPAVAARLVQLGK